MRDCVSFISKFSANIVDLILITLQKGTFFHVYELTIVRFCCIFMQNRTITYNISV